MIAAENNGFENFNMASMYHIGFDRQGYHATIFKPSLGKAKILIVWFWNIFQSISIRPGGFLSLKLLKHERENSVMLWSFGY